MQKAAPPFGHSDLRRDLVICGEAEEPYMANNSTIFIAFGHRCSASAILDRCGLSRESLPFDGLVSKLSVIRDCLENDFEAVPDIHNYTTVDTRTT